MRGPGEGRICTAGQITCDGHEPAEILGVMQGCFGPKVSVQVVILLTALFLFRSALTLPSEIDKIFGIAASMPTLPWRITFRNQLNGHQTDHRPAEGVRDPLELASQRTESYITPPSR